MVIYMREKLFTLINYRQIKNYILTTNPANMLFTRYAFSDELLIICYEKTVKKIIPCIPTKKYLNFTIDETFNIHKK